VSLHIICERDVGLFSLIQQVIANIPWALREKRTPIVYFRERNCYWTPNGYHGKDSVWEYYFEPLFDAYPASTVPEHIRKAVDADFPNSLEVGYLADADVYVSNHFGDHPDLNGKALAIPYLLDDPGVELRLEASQVIRNYVHPRAYIGRKVEDFFASHMATGYTIGIHARGTDAISKQEIRPHRQGSLVLSKYRAEVQRLLNIRPEAKILVATDDQASLDYFKEQFGTRVIAYDSLRHEGGDLAGEGPTGWIMPAYIAGDRDRAARNGEEAVIEYLLLSRCNHLIHNAGSLARTVLLNAPDLPHTNTHRPQSS